MRVTLRTQQHPRLTLSSDATKDRFIRTYHLAEYTLSHNASITSTDFLPLPPALSKTRSHSQSNSHQSSVLNFNASQTKHSVESIPPSGSVSKGKAGGSISKTGLGLGLPSVAHESTAKPGEKEIRGKTKERAFFNATVIELVKLIQASLSIFGLFGSPATGIQSDGLLCDDTVEGIRRWIIDIGEPCVGLEVGVFISCTTDIYAIQPMERIADPVFVSAILSLVLSVRNKLVTLGFSHVCTFPLTCSLGSDRYTGCPKMPLPPAPYLCLCPSNIRPILHHPYPCCYTVHPPCTPLRPRKPVHNFHNSPNPPPPPQLPFPTPSTPASSPPVCRLLRWW